MGHLGPVEVLRRLNLLKKRLRLRKNLRSKKITKKSSHLLLKRKVNNPKQNQIQISIGNPCSSEVKRRKLLKRRTYQTTRKTCQNAKFQKQKLPKNSKLPKSS